MLKDLISTTPNKISPVSKQDDIVLSVEGVSKRFCRNLKRSLYYGLKDIVTEITGTSKNKETLRQDEFWALKDINFTLKRGEAVGLIGANGAGKTTLLKIISGLIKPDAGQVTIKGRLAPLIGLGAGFNHILTGRENVYVNMSILGLTHQEISDRFEEVLAFSEIGDAIDAPVKTYSSGMGARLGFACAIHTDPDILLIDEVLAVGDIKFRMKCYRKLAQLRANGTSFILVSHSSQSVLSICDSGLYFKKGQLITSGLIGDVIYKYEEDLFDNPTEKLDGRIKIPEKVAEESLGVDILEVCFKNAEGEILPQLISGEPAFLCINCKVRESIPSLGVKIIIRELAQENNYLLSLNSFDDESIFSLEPGLVSIQVYFPTVGLKRGLFISKIALFKDGVYVFDGVESFKFNVKSASKDMIDSIYYQQRAWNLIN